MTPSFSDRLVQKLVSHAARMMPAARAEWTRAMWGELAHVPKGERLAWAVGCAITSYRQRSLAMTQRIAGLARWVFALELGTCFVWPTLLFVALLAMSASMSPAVGYPSVAWLASMLAATVLGPLGLAVALDVLVRGRTRFNEVGIAVLAASAAWAFVAFTLQASAEDWSRPAINSWVLLALLPAIGAAHLLCAVWAARRGGATSAARQSR